MQNGTPEPRDILFISKATPGDNEFVLWLAPRLEAEGYKVFADILSLEPGDRWRREITGTLQNRAIKMLLCCRDATLNAEGVQEEIGIASDLVKELPDPKFIIPLRIEKYKKLFGIGEFQYINFESGWAQGLDKLLDTLRRQKVVKSNNVTINPNWEIFRRRGAIPLKQEPERLTSNWLRIAQAPDAIRFFEPSGAVNRDALERACGKVTFPVNQNHTGILTFAALEELDAAFLDVCRFKLTREYPLLEFIEKGAPELGLQGQDASNIAHSMFRQAWEAFCRKHNLYERKYSNALGFHVSVAQAAIGQKVPWGRQGDRRSSMLRNIAKGVVWQFGATALPAFWPFPHFKLKSRVLFAPPEGRDAGEPFDDYMKQHRLRRSVCKGWRNKQWHGRLMAYLEVLAGDGSYLRLPLSPSAFVGLEASPILFTSPVSTVLPNTLTDDDEEGDASTLGRPDPEDDQ
ncbi:MAG TPA: toll/interleukin-1 receptor domain-containing protein [Rhizomicrobium sp.]|nr:toll/interleukin-1 receptor domain-containing protein [Rhizomicrobium sp.]